MKKNSFYSRKELMTLGLSSYGKDVLISKKCSIYSAENIKIGNNVRIDDYCILSGNIMIGNNVHISAYSSLYGGGQIIINDYCGCSPYCCLLSATDDFSGEYMIGAVIDNNFKNVKKGTIILEKYVQLGAKTIVLPDILIKEGTVTGACSFVNKNLDSWGIYVGQPVKLLKKRSKNMLRKVENYERK